ncbi:hypothetical protein M427DRAFT_62553 [Gonapodya prolifera JEL478]|uniref:Periplasmic binding protein-like II n=1 Tax=Gonapodya prolifera (strain JEL478) TaxID=1344416 RepID=A0A139A0W6_GONPJ|nr:hypothetical protein M427DRAFT_62553 [Gonapodya prolifera JEL478]|eukprot:KXS10364.1 hypothetical protein M427DRAFT_62553 [Gonapodya prolifera JEL478]
MGHGYRRGAGASCTLDYAAIAFFLSLALAALVRGQNSNPQSNCQNDKPYDPAHDYFPNQIPAHPTPHWTVSYSNSYKIISNILLNQTYILYQCNTPVPAATNFPPGAKFFSVPAQTVGATHQSVIRFLERLELRSSIKHVPSIGTLTSPCLLSLAIAGQTKNINTGWDGTNVDVVFGAAGTRDEGNVGGLDVGELPNGVLLPLPPDTPPLEHTSLLLLASTFFNLEQQATSLWSQVSSSYECAARGASDALLQGGGKKPVVAWLGVRDDKLVGTTGAGWKARAIMDAGASSLVSPTFSPSSALLAALRTSDILIDDTPNLETMSDVAGAYGIGRDDYLAYPFLREKMVFRWDGRRSKGGVDDFPRSRPAMADHLVRDLVAALWPGAVGKGWRREWLRNVARGDDFVHVSADSCPGGNTSSPFDATFAEPECRASFPSAAPPPPTSPASGPPLPSSPQDSPTSPTFPPARNRHSTFAITTLSLFAALVVLGSVYLLRRRPWIRQNGYFELGTVIPSRDADDEEGQGGLLGGGEETGWEGEPVER